MLKIFVVDKELVVRLPLTRPTSKIRVKHKDRNLNYGLPKRTKEEEFTVDDYVEWQISYATENPPEDLSVSDITIIHNNNIRIGFELTKLLFEGVKAGIISDRDLYELEKFIESIRNTDTLEENERILREGGLQETKGGFQKFIEKTPVFIKDSREDGYFVEIVLKHRQRAVGLQSMIFLCIYIKYLKDMAGNPLIGRKAQENEFGEFRIDRKNRQIIIDVVKAFAIASLQHKSDISEILRQVKEKCRL